MPPTPAAQQSPDCIISLPQAARIAGVSPWTLKRRASEGELTILRISTRRIGIRMSEISRWMDTLKARA
jgi:predicted DNA-binding transcriptional regulator AlpA